MVKNDINSWDGTISSHYLHSICAVLIFQKQNSWTVLVLVSCICCGHRGWSLAEEHSWIHNDDMYMSACEYMRVPAIHVRTWLQVFVKCMRVGTYLSACEYMCVQIHNMSACEYTKTNQHIQLSEPPPTRVDPSPMRTNINQLMRRPRRNISQTTRTYS